MDDQEHADNIKHYLACLREAIKEAKEAGLRVDTPDNMYINIFRPYPIK